MKHLVWLLLLVFVSVANAQPCDELSGIMICGMDTLKVDKLVTLNYLTIFEGKIPEIGSSGCIVIDTSSHHCVRYGAKIWCFPRSVNTLSVRCGR